MPCIERGKMIPGERTRSSDAVGRETSKEEGGEGGFLCTRVRPRGRFQISIYLFLSRSLLGRARMMGEKHNSQWSNFVSAAATTRLLHQWLGYSCDVLDCLTTRMTCDPVSTSVHFSHSIGVNPHPLYFTTTQGTCQKSGQRHSRHFPSICFTKSRCFRLESTN